MAHVRAAVEVVDFDEYRGRIVAVVDQDLHFVALVADG
jgi:hypothetical protein